MQRGSSKYGADVVVGSTEYMRRWRAANKDKHKLQVLKYKARQKQLLLAAKLAQDDGISMEQALAEVQGTVDKLDMAKKLLIAEGRIGGIGKDFEPVQVVEEAPNPFIKEQAEKFNLTYDEALDVMDAEPNPNNWDEALAAKRDSKEG